MLALDPILWFLILLGGTTMGLALLRGVVASAGIAAQDVIGQRREQESLRRAANAAAAAAGRAASLEPLNLNPDGTIEEPIIGVVETAE